LRGQAAVDGQRLPDDKGRIAGSEKQHRTPNLFRLGDPADSDAVKE
jgi:hypothetical protein